MLYNVRCLSGRGSALFGFVKTSSVRTNNQPLTRLLEINNSDLWNIIIALTKKAVMLNTQNQTKLWNSSITRIFNQATVFMRSMRDPQAPGEQHEVVSFSSSTQPTATTYLAWKTGSLYLIALFPPLSYQITIWNICCFSLNQLIFLSWNLVER